MTIYDDLESQVRSYCRTWPTEFVTAEGSRMTDAHGVEFLDFFAGAGALNYGHNPPPLRDALVDYLTGGGVTHSLDMHTAAKTRLLTTLRDTILRPRGMDYRVQFVGPTGTNAVEAALKLVRKNTGRRDVVSFTDAFHGMTLGSLAVTGNASKRAGAGVPLPHTLRLPYDGYLGDSCADEPFASFERMLGDPSSGLERPAGVIVETVQGEGGLNAARASWLRSLAQLCRRHDILLIVDDIQMGVGRTGPFFSFESAGIEPDVVCLSKSISGYGLPMSLVLLRPDLDTWSPGEHNGTFRGNNHAFVTAEAALRHYWHDDTLTRDTEQKAGVVTEALERIARGLPDGAVTVRGRGLAQGLAFREHALAEKVCALAFESRVIVETAGPRDEVVKLMPALTVEAGDLECGLQIIGEAVQRVA